MASTQPTPDGDHRGGLTLLGRSTPSPVFELLEAAARGQEGPKLETVAAEPGLVETTATIEILVCWCPYTHQIDYYLPVEITYAPRRSIVESKSLKLYGEWFLTQPMFAETLAVRIARDVLEATDAHWVRVEAYQAVRGGIRLTGIACLPLEASGDSAEQVPGAAVASDAAATQQ
jgi:NADPH-dependent 7-cyano-7-deazaguanine reductase QueF